MVFIRWWLTLSEVVKMWEEHPEHWKTESAFLSFIRGGIRRYLWSKNPVKLDFVKESAIQIVNTNPRSMKAHPTVKGGQCEICKGLFKADQMEVDHRSGEFSLRKIEDIQKFVEGIVFIRKEDLAHLCKPCHATKTHAERYDMSFDEAKVEKQVIELNKKPAKMIAFLKENGIIAASNAKKRREQATEFLMRDVK